MIFKMCAIMFLVGTIMFVLSAAIGFVFNIDPPEWLWITILSLVTTGGVGILGALVGMILVR